MLCQSPLTAVPTPGQSVWIRRLYFDDPWPCFWLASEQLFASLPGRFSVTGAGIAAANGFYTPIVGANYYPTFLNTTTDYAKGFALSTSLWTLAEGPGNLEGSPDYDVTAANFPSGPWTDESGNNLAPTVIAALTIPWWAVSRWAARS